ncbi:SRPBCC family protein [Micromonospora sp. NPDC003776]
MYSTQVSQLVKAPRSAVFQALLDPAAVATWRVPTGMSGHVHEFDAREGGSLRVSLTYEAPDNTGKSTAHTDTYHGHFTRIVPGRQVVEVVEFETDDPALAGAMTMTTTLTDVERGTQVVVVHDGIPDAIPAEDNETGTRIALANLARLVEAGAAEDTAPR